MSDETNNEDSASRVIGVIIPPVDYLKLSIIRQEVKALYHSSSVYSPIELLLLEALFTLKELIEIVKDKKGNSV